MLRAAARAQKRTGASHLTHASMYPVGAVQLAIMREEGVDPGRVVIGHCDTYLNPSYHAKLLHHGVTIAFGTIGRQPMNPDTRGAKDIVDVVRHGSGGQMLLSSDRSTART